MQREALFSPCGAYRYRLSRDWNGTGTRLAVVMLNPSTADAARDDPTIRRCIAFAVREGHCGVEILNLFAFSATEPALLKSAADPVGPLTMIAIWRHCSRGIPAYLPPGARTAISAGGRKPCCRWRNAAA